jgi:hypothetical protein
MRLTPDQIERLRASGIRLDEQGTFWHEGQPVAHAGLRAALWRWLDVNPDGRFVLRLDAERFVYLDVDGAPHHVRSLRWEAAPRGTGLAAAREEPQAAPRGTGLAAAREEPQSDRAQLLLADGSEEELDYGSLRLSPDGRAYCRVKRGRFEARLSTAAWAALGERIEERDGRAVLRAAGSEYPIG